MLTLHYRNTSGQRLELQMQLINICELCVSGNKMYVLEYNITENGLKLNHTTQKKKVFQNVLHELQYI